MDSTNDVICGTCVNYTWPSISNYALSLSSSGFKGRKVLFIHNVNIATRNSLSRLGFELIEFTPKMNNVVIERFKVMHDWMSTQKDIRYIIHCDVRDVVIQADPSVWMEKQTAKIFGASECIVYKDEACNPFWVEQLFGKEALESLSEAEVICAGTIAGEAKTIERLIKRIFELSTDRFGDDQAALNILLRSEFKDEVIIPGPEESFILTAGWWLIGAIQNHHEKHVGKRSQLVNNPPELRGGIAYPHSSDIPFALVHQYERGNTWVRAIRARCNNSFIPTGGDLTLSNPDALISAVEGSVQPIMLERFSQVVRAHKHAHTNAPHREYLENQMAEIAPDVMFTNMRSIYEDTEHGGPRTIRPPVLLKWLGNLGEY